MQKIEFQIEHKYTLRVKISMVDGIVSKETQKQLIHYLMGDQFMIFFNEKWVAINKDKQT